MLTLFICVEILLSGMSQKQKIGIETNEFFVNQGGNQALAAFVAKSSQDGGLNSPISEESEKARTKV